MTKLSRRDFLKLAGALSVGGLLSRAMPALSARSAGAESAPNIIVILFDAMSARNLSAYGYARATTPNLERFVERATVYRRHYSGGNFTTSGTASVLTGLYPWTHRAINLIGVVNRAISDRNIFHQLGDRYYRLGFSQNSLAESLLNQFDHDIDEHLLPGAYGLFDPVSFTLAQMFERDSDAALRAMDMLYSAGNEDVPGSLLFGFFERLRYQARIDDKGVSREYPPGGLPSVPESHLSFRLEAVFDGLKSKVFELAQTSPFFIYYHFWSPHAPYKPRKGFNGIFDDDDFSPVYKAQHPLASRYSSKDLNRHRQKYDEYIADVDAEFGRLMDAFEQGGVFDNSYVFVVSDHGELFERGEWGHTTPLLFEPVIHTPLLVSSPGQKSRRDVLTPTSNVDLLPTILSIAGKPIPDWCEGQVLPGFDGGREDAERSVFTVEAKENVAFAPLTKATVSMVNQRYKLVKYLGYGDRYPDTYELYDLEDDSDERKDRFADGRYTATASRMVDELMAALEKSNQGFR
jgi:arylsulfatase A-like enzyme